MNGLGEPTRAALRGYLRLGHRVVVVDHRLGWLADVCDRRYKATLARVDRGFLTVRSANCNSYERDDEDHHANCNTRDGAWR